MEASQFQSLPNTYSSRSISQPKYLNPLVPCKHSKSCFFRKNVVDLDYLQFKKNGTLLARHKSRRTRHFFLFASADDGLTVNGSPQASTSSDIGELRVKKEQPLQSDVYNGELVQSLHDAARVFELAIRAQISGSKLSWISAVGVDQNAWVKPLSYQASVCSLLLAACEITSRGDGIGKDINDFVQNSLSRLCATLESVIKDTLSDKKPELFEWFWSEQNPGIVSNFVSYFEEDSRFTDVTGINKRMSSSVVDTDGKSLLIFALNCIAAITKLGPTKVSCPHFYSLLPKITGKLMEMLIELIPIRKAYHSIEKIVLDREFLVHFGPRAAACRGKDDQGTEEVLFWVSLAQKQLQRAIGRERIWSKLTSETIEVLYKDLAIFGFFIALGRKTQWFLSSNNFEAIPEPIEGIIRYFIGGSVLYYPQLSSISSYQLYVEVVCEELDWLPFYPGVESLRHSHGHGSKNSPPSEEDVAYALDVCSHWIQSFIKYNKRLEDPSNVKASRFLSRGHNILKRSMEELGLPKKLIVEYRTTNFVEIAGFRRNASSGKDLDSFDKALESVDEAVQRLEVLLQKQDVSSSNFKKERLKAAYADLKKIKRLKKEAEFLEASFKAKADSIQQGDDNRGMKHGNSNTKIDRSGSKARGLWNFLVRRPTPTPIPDLRSAASYRSDNTQVPEVNEIHRSELLRNELKELERLVERIAKRSNDEEEEIDTMDDTAKYSNDAKGVAEVKVQEKENFLEKSLHRFKQTTTDVLQGTQLLAIDVAAAMGLLLRVLTGTKLMEKEKQALLRTLTDLASAIPIGFLMLLPVTAVGHAAMLAAIQRYIPSLIPSTYGPERLDLLRQLKKVKEMDTIDADPTTSAVEQ